MKKQSLQLLVAVLLILPSISSAQTDVNQAVKPSSDDNTSSIKKGEWSVGMSSSLSGFLSENSSKYLRFSPRIGYMMSKKDMLFVEANFNSYKSGTYKHNFYDMSINYRRYFLKTKLKPFVQTGLAVGFSPEKENYESSIYYYGDVGIGLSYRYKRWSFESGLKMDYHLPSFSINRIRPFVGGSFSF
ncbi:MAG: hypothetical protein GQ527_02675 [Bacteroidales bacterium]|nr:hypothetical protein [Bacteroidales bacterium]